MDDANDFARLQFDEEEGTFEILLLTCRVGNQYYPGNEPLHLAIKGRKEVWGLTRPLLNLICKEHEGVAVVAHRGTSYHLTHALWRSLVNRLQDYLESVEVGIPTWVTIIPKS